MGMDNLISTIGECSRAIIYETNAMERLPRVKIDYYIKILVTSLLVLFPAASPFLNCPPSTSPAVCDLSMALNAIVSEGLATDVDRQASVRMYINSTLSDLIDQLSLPSDQARPSITIRCRANPTSCVFNQATGALETRQDVSISRTYSWPGSTAYESWKFSRHPYVGGHGAVMAS